MLAKSIFFVWPLGVPILTGGLVAGVTFAIAAGSALLLAGVSLNAVQGVIVATGAAAEAPLRADG